MCLAITLRTCYALLIFVNLNLIITITTTIFYFSTIIFLWIEMSWIVSPIEQAKNALNFHLLAKQNKGLKWDQYSEKYKDSIKSKVLFLPVILWVLIGLFTGQWIIFLAFLIYSFLIIAPINKLVKPIFPIYVALNWLNSVVGFAFGVFVVVNHYHLKIDVYSMVVSCFNCA